MRQIMRQTLLNFKPRQRKFIPQNFKLTNWEKLKPFYNQLLEKPLDSLESLEAWFLERSELEGIIAEEAGWRYINMTRDTTHAAYRQQYVQYIEDMLPHIMLVSNQLDQKAITCPYIQAIRAKAGFKLLIRSLETNVLLYRPDNIPLLTKLQLESQKYSQIVGSLTIAIHGKELTLPQAAIYLEEQDRTVRQDIYTKINQKRLEYKDQINVLYTNLIQQRHQVALNAGFNDFRDYAFVSLKRFDYSPQDCFNFHQGIETAVMPFINELAENRRAKLKLTTLKPWDHAVDPTGQPPLHPFKDTSELLQKTIAVFDQLDPFLGNCLRTMQKMQRFDLASRKGKAPGGYNYPLLESGIPFIFMNAGARFQDMITMLHEGGHAVHSILMHQLSLNNFKQITSEMAELASMSMELLTMDQWHLFFERDEDLKRAKREQLESIVTKLAWIATIDQFQHWVYENPTHTYQHRKEQWNYIFTRFSDSLTSWSGQEQFRDFFWQKQLHLFEVPFYYIEYGIAQLGAIAIWRNFQQDPQQTLKRYLEALSLGYMHPLPVMYQKAGIKFSLNPAYIQELIAFVRQQWEILA